MKKEQVTQDIVSIVKQLSQIANERNQSLAQMSLAWALRNEVVTSLIVGVSSVKQLDDNLKTIDNLSFSDQQLMKIDSILDGTVH